MQPNPTPPPQPEPIRSPLLLPCVLILSLCGIAILSVIGAFIISEIDFDNTSLSDIQLGANNTERPVDLQYTHIAWLSDNELYAVQSIQGVLYDNREPLVPVNLTRFEIETDSRRDANLPDDLLVAMTAPHPSNGQLVCLERGGVVHVDCMGERRTFFTTAQQAVGAWSADGEVFALVGRTEILFMDNEGVITTYQLSLTGFNAARLLAWHPTEQRMAILLSENIFHIMGTGSQVIILDYAGGNPRLQHQLAIGIEYQAGSTLLWRNATEIVIQGAFNIHAYDVASGRRLAAVVRQNRVIAPTVLPSGELVVGNNDDIELWNQEFDVIRSIDTPANPIQQIVVSPNGRLVAVVGPERRVPNGVLHVYNIETGDNIYTYRP